MVVQGVEEVLSVSNHGQSLWGRHSWALFAQRDRPVLADFGFPLGDELLQDGRRILVVLSLVAHLVQLLLKVEELLLQLGFALASPRGTSRTTAISSFVLLLLALAFNRWAPVPFSSGDK